MLKIITGRSGSGKTEIMLKMMRETEGALYIVPEQYSFAAEKKITSAFGMSGMGKPSVYSFRRLAYHLEEMYGCGTGEELQGVGRIMVLSDITNKLAGELSLFGGAAKRGNMAEEAAVIITTFKQYGVTREKIEKAMESTENSLLKKKLYDCLLINDAYDKFLKEGYRDSEDLLEGLARNIADSCFMEKREVFIDSFQAFTPLEYKVIAHLMKKCVNVTVALCAADGGDEFVTAKNTLERLKRICKEAGVPFGGVRETEGGMFAATDEMKTLEQSFFDENLVYGKKTEKVHTYKSKDEYSEALNAAREVENLCRDYGYRYRDIVIVARDTEPYEKHLKRAFEIFDIPLFIDKKTPLSGEAAAIFALSAIKIISRGWRSRDVFCYMKSIFAPVDPIRGAELENYALAAGVRYGDWKREDKWSMPLSVKERDENESYLARINETKEQIVTPILELERKIKGRHTGREMCEAFYEFLEECGLESKIEKIADLLEKDSKGIYAMRARQVYDLIIGVLECFCDAFGDKKMSAKEFLELIEKGIESVEIGVIPANTDCVCAGSIDRAKGHGARCVIIIGANEGVFPAAPKDTGIFTNSDRREMEKYGIELPPDTFGKTFMEESLTYSALSCGTDRVYASYSGGKEGAGPSVIIKRLGRVFPYREDVTEGREDAVRLIGSAKSTYEDFAAAYAKIKSGEKVAEEWYTALSYYENNPIWKDRVREVERCASFENRTELIRRELIKARYGDGIKTSVSALEQYAQCPFAYFAKVTLGLQERKEISVTAADSGTFLHDFVDAFGKGLKEDGKTWRDADEEYIDRRADEITRELIGGINKHLLETSPRVRYLFTRLKRIAKRSVMALSEHMKKGKFEPLGYEIMFGNDGEFAPLTIDLPNGDKAVLRGRVDRADILETSRGKFVRIIDYKSGDKKFSLSNIYYGLDLQLAIYLTAICEEGEYRPGGMLYFRIDDPAVDRSDCRDEEGIERAIMKKMKMDGLVLEDDEILSAMDEFYKAGSDVIPVKKNKDGTYSAYSKVATENEFKAISKHAKSTVRKLCNEILLGKADISPTKNACKYCAMKAVCGFDPMIKGCGYRVQDKINDKDALLKIIEESK